MIKYFQTLFDYNNWANSQIIEKLNIIENSDDNSLQLMSHIISVQDNWLERVKGTKSFKIDIWEVYSVQELQILSESSTRAWQKFISKLSNDDLENICIYKNSKGKKSSNTYLEILTQLFSHSNYHRGQINQNLRKLEIEPPLIDFIIYTWTIYSKQRKE